MPDSRIDRWVQRATVAALVTLALTLMGVGVALYAPAFPQTAHGAVATTNR